MKPQLVPVFDLGGVFIDWNPLYLFRKLFETEEEALWFHKNVCTLGWNLEFDRGETFEAGVAKLIPQHPKFWRQIQAYDTRWPEMLGDVFEGTVAIHNELIAADFPTYAITNFSSEKWMLMLEHWPFLEKFNGVVVSGVEKIIKPDPRLYEIFCQRFNLTPDRCVFIDDNEANIVSARAFGMKGIHFTSAKQTRGELIDLGFPLKSV